MKSKHKALGKKVHAVCNAMNRRNTNARQVIDDLMQLACNLITEPAFIPGAFKNTLYCYRDGFRNELSHYKEEPKAWALLQELYFDYQRAILDNEPFTDIVGMMYDENIGKNDMGQFLTPPDLANNLMPFLIGAVAPKIVEPTRIGDICGCGAGSLILGQIKGFIQGQGEEVAKHLHVVGVDLDVRMVRMTTAQVVLSSIFHRIPLGSFTSYRANAITEFGYTAEEDEKHLAYFWKPEVPKDEYFKAIFAKELHALEQITARWKPEKKEEVKTVQINGVVEGSEILI